ncbi:hypothetical protein CEQ90_13575 [Lewinellaceae bacterium SD302]|nr:hypothetical protein CEQ90_13575 [Lewinellaceae bacterium SD302]
MKQFSLALMAIFTLLSFTACDDDSDDGSMTDPTFGSIEIEFDNVIGSNDDQRGFGLSEVGSTDYSYSNGMEQNFNVTLLRYFVSNVRLEGEDGLVYEDETLVDAVNSKGYYLIDEADGSSQTVTLENVPTGEYDRIVFTLGVDSSGVLEGAAGGVLDPATNHMFWNWNAGYVALKFEGQSDVSVGGAFGETVDQDTPNGIVYHLGGWKEVDGAPAFTNNVREISLDFDSHAHVAAEEVPRVHLEFDVESIFKGPGGDIDFTGNNNVHRPVDGSNAIDNVVAAFRFDHIHE